jgi:hypothetical protein
MATEAKLRPSLCSIDTVDVVAVVIVRGRCYTMYKCMRRASPIVTIKETTIVAVAQPHTQINSKEEWIFWKKAIE